MFEFGKICWHSTLCRLLCFYICVCICTISLNTYIEFLFRLRIAWKRQIILFWTNWNQYSLASQMRIILMHGSWKVVLLGFFPLQAMLKIWGLSVSGDFNILWKIHLLNSVPSALQMHYKETEKEWARKRLHWNGFVPSRDFWQYLKYRAIHGIHGM